MKGQQLLVFTSLAIGVLGQPLQARNTSPANIFSREVPMCGTATNIKCGMNVCCSVSNFCGVSLNLVFFMTK